jgi:hypothetical protein
VHALLQFMRFLDVFEWKHGPGVVALVLVDHSTVQAAKDRDALLVQKMTKHDVPLKEGEELRPGWYMDGDARVEQQLVVDNKKKGIVTILQVCMCVWRRLMCQT